MRHVVIVLLLGPAAFGLGSLVRPPAVWALSCGDSGVDGAGSFLFDLLRAELNSSPVDKDEWPFTLVGEVAPLRESQDGTYVFRDAVSGEVYLTMDSTD
jgi:hypothetical protein